MEIEEEEVEFVYRPIVRLCDELRRHKKLNIEVINDDNKFFIIKVLSKNNRNPSRYYRRLLGLEIEYLKGLDDPKYKREIELYSFILTECSKRLKEKIYKAIRTDDRKDMEIIDGGFFNNEGAM